MRTAPTRRIKALNTASWASPAAQRSTAATSSSDETFGHREGEFPVCEDVAARSVALPFFPEMTEGQVARVAQELSAVLG